MNKTYIIEDADQFFFLTNGMRNAMFFLYDTFLSHLQTNMLKAQKKLVYGYI